MMNEHDIQVSVIEWFRWQYPELLLFAIPNGGARNAVTGKKLKDEGVTPGIPDLFLAKQHKNYGGLFIEIKTNRGRLSKHQKEIHDRLQEQGYAVITAHGYDEATSVICEYLADA
jgi:VRR-NUC domain